MNVKVYIRGGSKSGTIKTTRGGGIMNIKSSEKEAAAEKTTFPFVTVGIITYYPDKDKLFKVIDSVLRQKGVHLQLVFSDDGSEENYFNGAEQYLIDKGFVNYKFVENKVNQGTVINCISAVEVADGTYVKLLSPGDYLCGEFALKDWIEGMELEKADWSFCDSYYYQLDENEKKQLVRYMANPRVVEPYINKDEKMCRWNYIGITDFVLGAATLYRKDILLKYLNEIKGKIIYAEDYILSLMMLDKRKVFYMQSCLLLYEYGTGISTNQNLMWAKKLRNDYMQLLEIMLGRMKVTCREDKRIYKVILINKTSNKWMTRIKKAVHPIFLWRTLKFILSPKRFTSTIWLQEENQ